MEKVIIICKGFLIYSIGLLLFYQYIISIYQVSILEVIHWCYENHSQIDIFFIILIVFFVSFIFVWLSLTGILSSIFMSIFGKLKTYVYLGNSSEYKGIYCDMHNPSKKTIKLVENNEFNTSFLSLYRISYTLSFFGSNMKIAKNRRFDFQNLLLMFFLGISFFTILSGATHYLIYPAYSEILGANRSIIGNGWEESFEMLISQLGLNRGILAVTLFGPLIGLLPIQYFMNWEEKYDNPDSKLPLEIRHNNNISGVPVKITNETITIRKQSITDDSTTTSSERTGNKFITLKISEKFDPPVYISTLLKKSKKQKELLIKLNEMKQAEKPVKLKIMKDLSVTLDI